MPLETWKILNILFYVNVIISTAEKTACCKNNRVCGSLQQPFRLVQQLQIWQAYPSTKGDASWEISFQPLPYFLRYGNLQQILIKNAAFCSNPVNWACPAPSNMKEEVKIHHHAKFHIFCRKWSLYLHPSKLKYKLIMRKPVAQRQDMVIGTLALLWYFILVAAMWAGQQP